MTTLDKSLAHQIKHKYSDSTFKKYNSTQKFMKYVVKLLYLGKDRK